MTTLPYFIDRADGDWQAPAPRPQARPYFLFVGRLEAIKGLQTLIAAWDKVPDFDLLVAGDGEYAGALRAQAAGNPRIRFLGHVPQDQLGALYVHAVACIVPSLVYETFGIIVIEAFMRKTPGHRPRSGVARPRSSRTAAAGSSFAPKTSCWPPSRDWAPPQTSGRRSVSAATTRSSATGRARRTCAQYYALLEQTATTAWGRVPWQD